MAFRTTSLSKVYSDTQISLARLKAYLQGKVFMFSQQPTSSYTLFEILGNLQQARQLMDEAAQTPGIVDYAINEQNDPTYDISAEYTALRANIDIVINWMVNSYPRDTTNTYILLEELDANGNRVPRYFLEAELGDLPTYLQDIIDLID